MCMFCRPAAPSAWRRPAAPTRPLLSRFTGCCGAPGSQGAEAAGQNGPELTGGWLWLVAPLDCCPGAKRAEWVASPAANWVGTAVPPALCLVTCCNLQRQPELGGYHTGCDAGMNCARATPHCLHARANFA